MSKVSNVHSGHYKVAGRGRQGEGLLQQQQKRAYAGQRESVRRAEVQEHAGAPAWETTPANLETERPSRRASGSATKRARRTSAPRRQITSAGMTLRNWFLAELKSEAAKSRHVLEQVPSGKRAWKPHKKSMEFGYLADLVANIPSWIGLAIHQDELDIAPKDGPKNKPVPLSTSAELVAALDRAVAQARQALEKTTDAHLMTSWRLLSGGKVGLEQPRHDVIRDTFLHSAHHRGQLMVYLRLLGSKVPSVYGPTADDRSFG